MAKKYNYELYRIFNDSNTVNSVEVKRLSWRGGALDVYERE
jgi:hypothetical protein